MDICSLFNFCVCWLHLYIVGVKIKKSGYQILGCYQIATKWNSEEQLFHSITYTGIVVIFIFWLLLAAYPSKSPADWTLQRW